MEPITEFNLLSIVAKKMLGMLGQGQMMEVVRMIRWNLMEEAIFLLPFDVCSPPNHCLIMNIITWNCQGALKPSFQNHVRDLVQNHDLVVMIIMETQIGGDQARGIIDKLPFDGAIHTETIGFAGGSLAPLEFGKSSGDSTGHIRARNLCFGEGTPVKF